MGALTAVSAATSPVAGLGERRRKPRRARGECSREEQESFGGRCHARNGRSDGFQASDSNRSARRDDFSIEGGGLSRGGKSPSAAPKRLPTGLERPSAGLDRAGGDRAGPSTGPPRGPQGPTGRGLAASPFLRPLAELAASPSSLRIKSGGSPAGRDAGAPMGATPAGQSLLDRQPEELPAVVPTP